MDDPKQRIDYDSVVRQKIRTVTGQYWYLPFVKNELQQILSDNDADKKTAYKEINHWIQHELKQYRMKNLKTDEDEVERMFNHVGTYLSFQPHYPEIAEIKSEFSILRNSWDREKKKIYNPRTVMRFKGLIQKFYKHRFVSIQGN